MSVVDKLLAKISLTVNGRPVRIGARTDMRLSRLLREELGLTGTKVGCDAGDCGACTVLVDGEQACACLVPAAQLEGRRVTTIEGLSADPLGRALQRSFHHHGAAQCGICTPAMLIAGFDCLRRAGPTDAAAIETALAGVLCRCTGYLKIAEAVADARRFLEPDAPQADAALAVLEGAPPPGGDAEADFGPTGSVIGARIPRLDGLPKLDGTEIYGADTAPPNALWLRAIRSPYARARFTIGDLDAFLAAHPGIRRVLTAADVPGENSFGIFPGLKDQPVFAVGETRHRGEPVAAVVGERAAIDGIKVDNFPLLWEFLEPPLDIAMAVAAGAELVHVGRPGNILVRGHVEKGDALNALAGAAHVAEGVFETTYVEHGYIEPEAGFARRIGETIEIFASTQAPYMDRDEVARVLAIDLMLVRIIPSACGGGFGGKLDVSVQPMLAVAAWLTGQPVRCAYTRPESMAATTKRHPARISARAGCDAQGRLAAYVSDADFDTGPYASWGPTVAGRVPIHAAGPYRVPHLLNRSRAIHTNGPVAGAFRGFGVPQAAIAHEALCDELAGKSGIDRLEFRLLNALRVGDDTATGQTLKASAGLVRCLEALRPRWTSLIAEADAFNATASVTRRGIGLACMWYGIGNTALSNPSRMRLALTHDGKLLFFNGAVDIGQGSTTVLTQIASAALGLPVDDFTVVAGDTATTLDAGKTSASRQTFVSGKATANAALALRAAILRLTNAGTGARLTLRGAKLDVAGKETATIDLATLPRDRQGVVLEGVGEFDPPTEPLDANGQGSPYATYGFAAQIAALEVDMALGTVRLDRFVAAHDVGRAINPTLVEGQIHGGIAQGIGLALMEEYVPGRTENLHDYLIPTFGDVPEIEIILVEDPEPLGPYGAKGVGEPALVPAAPAILGAIRHATGVTIRQVPALPHRIRAALKAAGVAGET